MISIIVAIADNNLIGKDNKLPWHIPADLKHFKQLTMGKPIIMGRHTCESLPFPLPGRTNIVVSRQRDWQRDGFEHFTSLSDAMKAYAKEPELMIIGGAGIYQDALPFADTLYLTQIHHEFLGDSYFPDWQQYDWEEIERHDMAPSQRVPFAYSFITLEKPKKA